MQQQFAAQSANQSETQAPVLAPAQTHNSFELGSRLIGLGAQAANCPGQLQNSASGSATLISTEETLRRLAAARELASALGQPLHLLSSTAARTAVALEDDSDPRDRKFLSGSAGDEAHIYCGSLDAAISRALVFAAHADTVCFSSARPDLSEAERFANAIHDAYPEKKLGFGYLPRPNGIRWNELDHRIFYASLSKLGYESYFTTQFGQTVFLEQPQFAEAGAWALIDDSLHGEALSDQQSPAIPAFRRRVPSTNPHSMIRRARVARLATIQRKKAS